MAPRDDRPGGSDARPPRVPRLARALNRLTSPNSAPPPVLRAHQRLYQRTAGRIGHGVIGAPTLLLQTTGRRSGGLRTNALVYARDGGAFVLAASNDGADTHPAWFHNLRADPRVALQVGPTRVEGRARVVERSDPDYERLWALMNATNHGRYDHYQAQTSRPIPLVVVDPG